MDNDSNEFLSDPDIATYIETLANHPTVVGAIDQAVIESELQRHLSGENLQTTSAYASTSAAEEILEELFGKSYYGCYYYKCVAKY